MGCRGCVYAFKTGKGWVCQYILVSGHRRGCSPRNCVRRITDMKKMPVEERKRMKNNELFGQHDAEFIKHTGTGRERRYSNDAH